MEIPKKDGTKHTDHLAKAIKSKRRLAGQLFLT